MEYKISKESAQKQIQLFYDYGLIGVDDIDDKRMKSALISSLNVLRRGIRQGALEIKVVDVNGNKELQTIQTLTRAKDTKITYKEPDGQSKLHMGNISDDNNYEKSYTLLGYLSGIGIAAFAKLKGFDMKIAECLSLVFLGV